jgi:hypothetical protein
MFSPWASFFTCFNFKTGEYTHHSKLLSIQYHPTGCGIEPSVSNLVQIWKTVQSLTWFFWQLWHCRRGLWQDHMIVPPPYHWLLPVTGWKRIFTCKTRWDHKSKMWIINQQFKEILTKRGFLPIHVQVICWNPLRIVIARQTDV